MAQLSKQLDQQIAVLADDRTSGATGIMDVAIDILRTALGEGSVRAAASGLCRAQPTMASVWNAAMAALAAESAPEQFEAFTERVARAPAALARFALAAFEPDGGRPLRIVTVSASASVFVVVQALSGRGSVSVACSESRPALEGRRLANRIARLGVPVSCFCDAAIAHALTNADAVIVGADAVGSREFVNKSGTWMLAAAAAGTAVPVYVAATRDKFASPALWTRLTIREGHSNEVWESPPPGVTVRNPYFERTPLDLVTSVISDAGVLGTGMVAQVCESMPLSPLTFAL